MYFDPFINSIDYRSTCRSSFNPNQADNTASFQQSIKQRRYFHKQRYKVIFQYKSEHFQRNPSTFWGLNLFPCGEPARTCFQTRDLESHVTSRLIWKTLSFLVYNFQNRPPYYKIVVVGVCFQKITRRFLSGNPFIHSLQKFHSCQDATCQSVAILSLQLVRVPHYISVYAWK